MAVKMLVTEDTPTKVVLQINPVYKENRDKTYASSRKSGRGYYRIFTILILAALYYFFTKPFGTLLWIFWIFTAAVFIVFAWLVYLDRFLVRSNKNTGEEITTTIDLDSQRAFRIEKSKLGEVEQPEMKLNEVRRVLIHCEELGHSCKLFLESMNSTRFEVNSAYDFEMNSLKDFGKKLGGLLNKPVILKWTEGGKVVSEEEI